MYVLGSNVVFRSFLIEGLITLVIGVFSWVLMPAGPCQTSNWFRGKDGWFTEHEEYILVNRLLRDDPSKGDMHNRYVYNRQNHRYQNLQALTKIHN